MHKLYLAGGYGFSEMGSMAIKSIETVLQPIFSVYNPFIESTMLGNQSAAIDQQLKSPMASIDRQKLFGQLVEINRQIGAENAKHIRDSDVILAILDGLDMDSGTCAEIGYAFGLGKRIFGYRSDFRNAGENVASIVNLQVQYFIEASGGKIFRSIHELKEAKLL